MRTEEQMLQLILNTAADSPLVRAVCMNGSRVNPLAPRDQWMDFDIAYLVSDMGPLVEDQGWLEVFGPRLIMQTPEAMELYPPSLGGWFTYLMQFADGNRIDLCLVPLSDLERYLENDTLVQVLLDKDGLLPPLPPPSDSKHHCKAPTPGQFRDCCNEFWWLVPYVAKGLWRDEPTYALEHLHAIRGPLLLMLGWQAGMEHQFAVSPGKCGKYLPRFLPKEEWDAYLATFSGPKAADIWAALDAACALFGQAANLVAYRLGYPYPRKEARQVYAYAFGPGANQGPRS